MQIFIRSDKVFIIQFEHKALVSFYRVTSWPPFWKFTVTENFLL